MKFAPRTDGLAVLRMPNRATTSTAHPLVSLRLPANDKPTSCPGAGGAKGFSH